MSKKIRVNVMMSPDLLEVLDGFCALTGKTRSALIDDLLRPSVPSLNELIQLQLKMKLKEMSGGSVSTPLESLDKLEQQLLKPLNELPGVIKNIHKNIEG